MSPSAVANLLGDDTSGYALTKSQFTDCSTNTELTLGRSFRNAYPSHHLSIVETSNVPLIKYANAGHASCSEISPPSDPYPESLKRSVFRHSPNRNHSINYKDLLVGYSYKFKDVEYLVYNIRWVEMYMLNKFTYLLSPTQAAADELILAAGAFGSVSHQEIWMFDRTEWTKSKELWAAVQNSSWDDVVLEPEIKVALRRDVEGFFAAKETYKSLRVAWKRGVIFHGPPGNGKTCSIKALMNSVPADTVQCLYIKSLNNPCQGPEEAIRAIFEQARSCAPCLLVFEDLDSLITDKDRSYFLNEVDGLESNDGILMIGSTNHLDRLDPSIAKRPSRFDRKYHFALPDEKERRKYVNFWKEKLEGNMDVMFPDELEERVAAVTEGFSFAYLKEMFVASLLQIAHEAVDNAHGQKKEEKAEQVETDDDLEKTCRLWKILKKQAAILQAEMALAEEDEKSKAKMNGKAEEVKKEEDKDEVEQM